MNNANFLAKWKPKHDQGIFKYTIKYILAMIIVLLSSAYFFSFKDGSLDTNNLYKLAKYDIVFVIFFSILILFNWFSSEKKYLKLLDDNKKADI